MGRFVWPRRGSVSVFPSGCGHISIGVSVGHLCSVRGYSCCEARWLDGRSYPQHLTVICCLRSTPEIARDGWRSWARIPALSAGRSPAWREKPARRGGNAEGETRIVDRARERKVGYVSLCLCPLVPPGLDYPEFFAEWLQETWLLDCKDAQGTFQDRRQGSGLVCRCQCLWMDLSHFAAYSLNSGLSSGLLLR